MKDNKFKNWEIALLLALCVTMFTGAWAQRQSAELSSSLVRLHVIAESDSDEEQAIKLRVRDSVLEYLGPRLDGLSTRDEALEVIEANLDGLKAAAASASEGREISIKLGRETYPTRDYGSFTLPAGIYTSLRVVLGEGQGHNWWCVVFPPLCTSIAEEETALETLSEDTASLISEDNGDGGVTIKFRVVELWGELVSLFSK